MSDAPSDDLTWFEHCLDASAPPLSPAGVARRAAMREMLTRRVVRGRRVRHTLRAALALAVVGSAAWLWHRPGRDSAPDPSMAPTMVHAELRLVHPDAPPSFAVQWVSDDDAILRRALVTTSASPAAVRIDDTEFLSLLLATDHAQGFVRIGAHVLLAADLQE